MNISDSNLAAAQLARLFGSELLNIQQSARTDSGGMPDIVKLDPKQFLVSQSSPQQDAKRNQQLLANLQREAELAFPLPEPQHVPPPPVPVAASPVEPVKSEEIVEALKVISDKIDMLSNAILKLASSK